MINKFYIDKTEFFTSTERASKFTIKSHPIDYEVVFEPFKNSFYENEIVLIDKNIQKLYNIQHSRLICIDAIEANKSIETVLSICERLLNYEFDKGSVLIVIGGGIMQDLGAYTAKTFKRGIKWVFYPTTLLSQCDSCIGGKTALNFKSYKNQLGLFSAPDKVIIDTRFLRTLSQRDINSGYGEIVKLFLIGGDFYTNNIKNFDIETCIFYALSIKKAIIEYDEFELHERKSLNYGHSFGHAIEALSNYSIPHGEAVMIGIEIINRLFTGSDQISDFIREYINVDIFKDIDLKKLVNNLKTDKKVKNGIMSFVAVERPGITTFIDISLDDSLTKKVYEIFIN